MDMTFLWCFIIVFTQSQWRIRLDVAKSIYESFLFFKESLKWTVLSRCMQYAEYNMLHVIHKSNGHICCPWNTIWIWKGLNIIIRYSHWSYLTAGMSLICKLRYKLFITEWILNYTMMYRCLMYKQHVYHAINKV